MRKLSIKLCKLANYCIYLFYFCKTTSFTYFLYLMCWQLKVLNRRTCNSKLSMVFALSIFYDTSEQQDSSSLGLSNFMLLICMLIIIYGIYYVSGLNDKVKAASKGNDMQAYINAVNNLKQTILRSSIGLIVYFPVEYFREYIAQLPFNSNVDLSHLQLELCRYAESMDFTVILGTIICIIIVELLEWFNTKEV